MKGKSEFQNFTYFHQGSSEFIIRNDLISTLLEDVGNNFSNSSSLQDVKIFKGRGEHFSYKPVLSNERLLVRICRRGGVMSFLNDLHFGKCRPFEELRISETLRALSINTPEIVAVKVQRTLGFLYKYVVVMKELENVEDLSSYLSKYHSEKKYILENVALELRNLHQKGVFHSDLNLKNILVAKKNEDLKVYFVDLDKSWRVPYLNNSKKLNNIARLYRSYEKLFNKSNLLSLCDKVRFLEAYGITRDDIKYAMANCGRWLWLHKMLWAVKGA